MLHYRPRTFAAHQAPPAAFSRDKNCTVDAAKLVQRTFAPCCREFHNRDLFGPDSEGSPTDVPGIAALQFCNP